MKELKQTAIFEYLSLIVLEIVLETVLEIVHDTISKYYQYNSLSDSIKF